MFFITNWKPDKVWIIRHQNTMHRWLQLVNDLTLKTHCHKTMDRFIISNLIHLYHLPDSPLLWSRFHGYRGNDAHFPRRRLIYVKPLSVYIYNLTLFNFLCSILFNMDVALIVHPLRIYMLLSEYFMLVLGCSNNLIFWADKFTVLLSNVWELSH